MNPLETVGILVDVDDHVVVRFGEVFDDVEVADYTADQV